NYLMQGIQQFGGSMIATGNLVRNMTGNSNGSTVMRGITHQTTSGIDTISQNAVHSLRNNIAGGSATAVYSIYAMDFSYPPPGRHRTRRGQRVTSTTCRPRAQTASWAFITRRSNSHWPTGRQPQVSMGSRARLLRSWSIRPAHRLLSICI